MIFPMKFASQELPSPGQFEYVATGTPGSETTQWTVPNGVFEVSMLVVSDGNSPNPARIIRGSTDIINSSQAISGTNRGGGNGGAKGADNPGQPQYNGFGGGGGAGGYDGTGGGGGNVNFSQNSPQSGGDGAGGGGGGGPGSYQFVNIETGQPGGINPGAGGGGVGMRGKGANGVGGQFIYPSNQRGSSGSTNSGAPNVGAGNTAAPGGNLRWMNAVQVIPGEILTISLGSSARDAPSGVGAGARIMWYGNRSYPSNAGNL